MPDLKQFRRMTGKPIPEVGPGFTKPPVSLREKLLLSNLFLHVLFLAICMGGVNWWAERWSLLFALISLLILAIPLPGEKLQPPSRQARAVLMRLLLFPPFWLGFGLIAYVWIQTWNVAWLYSFGPTGNPQMEWQHPIPWLPSGVIAPLEKANSFRGITYLIPPWISLCALWAGLHSRRSLNFFLNALALLFVIWGIAALYQHYNQIPKVLGIWETHPSRRGSPFPFWGTLINRNHGAFFLLLGSGLCLGLFLSGFARQVRNMRLGGFHLLHLGFALFLSFASAQAESRGATAMVILLWLGFFLICSLFFIRHFGWKGTLFPLLMVFAFVSFGYIYLSHPDRFERLKTAYEKTISLSENPELEGRYFMLRVTNDMIADRPWLGHGAGSFRFVYFRYTDRHRDIEFTRRVRVVDPDTGRRVWVDRPFWFRQAHLDLSEFLIEWGIIGSSFIWLSWLWAIGFLVYHRRSVDHGTITIIWTGMVLMIGASWEFHFRVPLLPLTWCLIMVAAIKAVKLRSG